MVIGANDMTLTACNASSPTLSQRRYRGFTLVEMMTVVSIVAVLAALAAPSFAEMIATQRVRTVTAGLTESLWVARAEATKRNTDVGFVFVDAATNWTIADPAGSATPLLTQSGSASLSSLTQAGASVNFSFNAYGRLSSGAGWIQIGDSSAGVYRCITVSTTGRAATTKGKCT